jgi:hypothetical protein
LSLEPRSPDLELLFVDWLNTIIYEMAIRNMPFARFVVTINGTRLRATQSERDLAGTVANHARGVATTDVTP